MDVHLRGHQYVVGEGADGGEEFAFGEDVAKDGAVLSEGVGTAGLAEAADEGVVTGVKEKQAGTNVALDGGIDGRNRLSDSPSRMSTTRAARRILGESWVSLAKVGIRSTGRLSTE